MMKAQYRVLGQLRKLDEKMLRLQTELDKLPAELKSLDEKLSSHKTLYEATKGNFDSNEKLQRKAEMDLREKEDFIKKAEAKMMECKTNEEYKAAQKEIDGYKAEKAKLEETVIALIAGMEGHRTKLKEAETTFKEQEAHVSKEKKEFEDSRSTLLKLFEEQTSQKAAITTQLSPEIFALYERVAKTQKGRGPAIVLAENLSCTGCNMRVRPQVFNEVLGYKVIHRCPNCGRILITASSDIDENTVGSADA